MSEILGINFYFYSYIDFILYIYLTLLKLLTGGFKLEICCNIYFMVVLIIKNTYSESLISIPLQITANLKIIRKQKKMLWLK